MSRVRVLAHSNKRIIVARALPVGSSGAWALMESMMLSDFFVADASEAPAVAKAKPPAKKWAALFARDLDEVKLQQLWPVVRGGSKKRLPAMQYLHTASDAGPWVWAVPEQLIERIAALSDVGLEQAAATWAEAEEFALDGWKQADVLEVLVGLREVCKRSRLAGKGLLLRIGL